MRSKIAGQSFPPTDDLHRLSSGADDDYRSGSATGHEGDDDMWTNPRTSAIVKFENVPGDGEEEELEREVIMCSTPSYMVEY